MWASSSVHKRVPTKDVMADFDRGEPISDRMLKSVGQEGTNPSWKLSFPHVCVATISSFLFGYHIGVVNEPLESISIDLGFAGNTLEEGLVVSTSLFGAFLGCCFSGWIADGVGRRRAFQLSALPMIIGAAMSATTNSLGGMLLGRLFVGTGMGLSPPVASLYITEISPSFVRGTYGSFIQIATCLGLIATLFIGFPVKSIPGWWRVCFWISIVPAGLLALCIEFCAESPHWLYKHGRIGEAEAQFEKLLGSFHVKPALAELSRADKGDESENINIKFTDLLRGRHCRVLFIGSTLFAFQQLSGINAVFYFSSTVFKTAGVPSNSANLCVGFANLSGSIIAMTLMDKLGRKLLLLVSFVGMAVAMGLQASASNFPRWAALYLSVGGMLLFVLAFSFGAGPVPSVLLAEMFPNKIRAKAMAICMCVHWVANFSVGLLFLPLLERLGAQIVYSMFAFFCFIAAIFVRRHVMETKGKTLQEIEISLLPPE